MMDWVNSPLWYQRSYRSHLVRGNGTYCQGNAPTTTATKFAEDKWGRRFQPFEDYNWKSFSEKNVTQVLDYSHVNSHTCQWVHEIVLFCSVQPTFSNRSPVKESYSVASRFWIRLNSDSTCSFVANTNPVTRAHCMLKNKFLSDLVTCSFDRANRSWD